MNDVTTSPLRVLFVTESREVWGAEESLLLILSEAQKHGIEAEVALRPGSPLAPRLAEIGVRFIEHRFASHPALSRNGSLSSATKLDLLRDGFSTLFGGLRGVFLVSRFDVVVPFSLWQTPETVLASRLTRRTSVIDIHETFHGVLGKKMVRMLAGLASGTISPSKHLAEQYQIAEARIIPRPVITPQGAVQPTRNDRVVTLGMFGQISPHKRVLELVQAFKALDSSVRLLIVGGRERSNRSEYELEVRNEVESMADGSQVVERQRDISLTMSQCDFVANVSEHEAFGRTVVEAIANGSTPLVLDGTGPAEIVRMTGIGYVFESIESLAAHAASRPTAPPSGPIINRVRMDFSPETIAAQYFDNLRAIHKKGHHAKT